MRRAIGLLSIIALTSCAPSVLANASAGGGVIPLRNGLNVIRDWGGGIEGEVFVAYRGNYNAHDYVVATFYVRAQSDQGDSLLVWQVLPFMDRPGAAGSRDALNASGGADCTLSDVRVMRTSRGGIEVIEATREFGQSYADSAGVRFDYYELARNSTGIVGWPPWYWRYVRTQQATHHYCDVNDAFDKELGLGKRGLRNSEATD
jgi:hypothetical protein